MSLGKNTRYSCTQGNLTEGEGSGTVDLHVLTSLDKLLFLLNILYETCYLNEEVTCTEPSFHLVFLGCMSLLGQQIV